MRFIFFIVVSFFSVFVKGQFGEKYIGNWIINVAETIDSTLIRNDLGFDRIRINSNSTIDIFLGHAFNENNPNLQSYRYAIIDNKLQIRTEPISEYLIEKITDKELILIHNNTRYIFNKLIIEESNGFLNNKINYKIVDKDTISIMIAPRFDGNFIKYFTSAYNALGVQIPSFVVEASFILRKNKQIDSIVILSSNIDTAIISQITNMIKSSQKKWIPAQTLNYNRIDSRVYIQILFKSSELANLKFANYIEIGSNIFSKAISLQNSNQNDLAEVLCSDYISLYSFLIYNHNLVGILYTEQLIESLNNALFNRSVLRIKLGKIDEACKDLKSIRGNKNDAEKAEKYIKIFCK